MDLGVLFSKMFTFVVLMLVRIPRMPNMIRIHIPRANFCCSQTARNKKNKVGKIMEKPNWPTHISRFRIFIAPPGSNG